jgi:hypothetical protein
MMSFVFLCVYICGLFGKKNIIKYPLWSSVYISVDSVVKIYYQIFSVVLCGLCGKKILSIILCGPLCASLWTLW